MDWATLAAYAVSLVAVLLGGGLVAGFLQWRLGTQQLEYTKTIDRLDRIEKNYEKQFERYEKQIEQEEKRGDTGKVTRLRLKYEALLERWRNHQREMLTLLQSVRAR
ncbi:MAG: hypothetical protein EXR55_05740 [Dehalococcoidia bacterium]|nr:hypothetical protein [Dehalococcoidia bacterium]